MHNFKRLFPLRLNSFFWRKFHKSKNKLTINKSKYILKCSGTLKLLRILRLNEITKGKMFWNSENISIYFEKMLNKSEPISQLTIIFS